MNSWTRFFIGTPRRFLFTCAGIAVAAAVGQIWPGMIQSSLNNLIRELSPILESVLVLVIIGVGFRVMMNGFTGKPKK